MLVQANPSNPLDDSIHANSLVEYSSVSPSHSSVSPFLNSVSEYDFLKGHSIASDESDLITPEPDGLDLLPAMELSQEDTSNSVGYAEPALQNMDFSDAEEMEDAHSPIEASFPQQPFTLHLKSHENLRLNRNKPKAKDSAEGPAKASSISVDPSDRLNAKPEVPTATDNKDSRVTDKDAFYIPWGSERDRLGCAPLYPQPLKSKTPLPSGFSLLSKNLRESLTNLTNAVVFPKPSNPPDNNGEGSSSEDQPPGDELYGCSFPNCNKTFNCIYNLRSHFKIHTSDRPFKCDVCDQSFSRNHDLKRHQKIHLGYKPYRCSICDRTFGRLDALKRHNSVRRCAERKAKSLIRK